MNQSSFMLDTSNVIWIHILAIHFLGCWNWGEDNKTIKPNTEITKREWETNLRYPDLSKWGE